MIKAILNIIIITFKMLFVIIKTILLLFIHFTACIICNPIISLINFALNKEILYVDICKMFGGRYQVK